MAALVAGQEVEVGVVAHAQLTDHLFCFQDSVAQGPTA
jgi:hypothetical protein